MGDVGPPPPRTPPASARSRSAPRRTPGTSPPPRAPRRRSRLSASTRKAARARCLRSCLRSFVRGRVRWLPVISARKVCIRVAARAVETPKSCSMSRRVRKVRSRFSNWLMASGMARSHRGLAGTVSPHPATRSPSAGVNVPTPSAATRTSTRRPRGAPDPAVGTTSGSTSGSVTAAPVPDRLVASVPRLRRARPRRPA